MPILFFFILLFATSSCTSPTNQDKPETSQAQDSSVLVALQYANNFTVKEIGKNTLLSIKSAWKNSQEKYEYLLYPKGEAIPTSHPNAIKVAVPVERIICTSTVDIAFLDVLESISNVVAISNGDYVYNKEIHEGILHGRIKDIGGNQSIDYEQALMTNPELAFVYSIGDQSSFKKFKEMNIPPVMLSDFMENSPLGRAEWLVFVSYFLGKEALAKAKFQAIATKYEALKKQGSEFKNKPTVLTGAVYKGIWHIAGGKSLMASFIRDAGGQYLWADNEEVSGVPLDFEAVYAQGMDADFWINMSHMATKNDLKHSEAKYSDFKAFQQGNIYNYYKRSTEKGGSDIFESAIVYPHLVLQDMIHIFHDSPVQDSSLYYYTALK